MKRFEISAAILSLSIFGMACTESSGTHAGTESTGGTGSNAPLGGAGGVGGLVSAGSGEPPLVGVATATQLRSLGVDTELAIVDRIVQGNESRIVEAWNEHFRT